MWGFLYDLIYSVLGTEVIMETTLEESDFVDIGYISDVHGLQGEIRVKHNTGFPNLRFGTVGILAVWKVSYLLLFFPDRSLLFFLAGQKMVTTTILWARKSS